MVILIVSQLIASALNLTIKFTLSKYLITITVMILTNFIISRKLINTSPVEAFCK